MQASPVGQNVNEGTWVPDLTEFSLVQVVLFGCLYAWHCGTGILGRNHPINSVTRVTELGGGWGGKREHYLTLLTSLLYDGIQLLQPLLQCLLLWQSHACGVGLTIRVARIYPLVN